MAKNSEKTLSELLKILESWFNHYIRLRDADEDGLGVCISCGKTIIYRTMDYQAGHYVPKTKSRLRFEEENVNSQCMRCNKHLRGNIHNYRKGMEEKYGTDKEREIWNMRNDKHSMKRNEVLEKIDYYKKLVKELQLIKGLK